MKSVEDDEQKLLVEKQLEKIEQEQGLKDIQTLSEQTMFSRMKTNAKPLKGAHNLSQQEVIDENIHETIVSNNQTTIISRDQTLDTSVKLKDKMPKMVYLQKLIDLNSQMDTQKKTSPTNNF